MFSLDIAILTWLTGTFSSWCTIGGLLTKFIPTAIIGVYGTKAITDIISIKKGTYKDVSKTKR